MGSSTAENPILLTKENVITTLEGIRDRKVLDWGGYDWLVVAYLAEYFKTTDLGRRELEFGVELVPLTLEAIDHLTQGTHPAAVKFENDVTRGHGNFSITDVSVWRLSHPAYDLRREVGKILDRLTGNGKTSEVWEALCGSEMFLLRRAIDRFMRKVYQPSLFTIIEACPKRCLNGSVGQAEIEIGRLIGALQISLKWRVGKVTHELCFIGDEGKREARMYPNFVDTDLASALRMLDGVNENWPSSPEDLRKIFK